MTESLYYPGYQNRKQLIHIADPDPATCEALSVLFRLEGFQTGFSIDVAQFRLAVERRRPDIILLNLRMGADDGLEVLRQLRMAGGATPVLAIEDKPEVENAVEAMKAGASDVVTKPIDTDRLLRLVRDALRQDAPVRAPVPGRRLDTRTFVHLTPREREVLELITSGQSNKEAGRELGISPRTIEVHRARVMEKLGARNTADLMRIVLVG